MSDRMDQSGPYDAGVGATRYMAVPAEPEPVVVSDDADETAEIRGDIEQTQAEMSETVNAIGERLSPPNLVAQAKDTVREATVGKAEEVVNSAGETARGAGSTITQTIRANPVPAAMAAIGLGWLIRKGSQSSSGRRPLDRSRRATASTTSTVQDKAGQVAGQAQDKAGQVASQAQDKAGQLVSQAQSQVSQLGDQAQDQAQALVGQTQYHAQRAQRGVQRLLQENPLAVGAAAVAAGAAVGLAIPGTRRENQLMGEARDNLMGKAQASAQETMNKVQRVAQEAQSAAQAAAQDQGLTG